MPYNYTLKDNNYQFDDNEQRVIRNNLPLENGHWSKSQFNTLKQNLKKDHLRKQGDRCGYCRNYVEPDGYYEPLEHILPKSRYPQWMLEPKNLIVTCNTCNNLKGDENTLRAGYSTERFPDDSDGYLIFNPHFDEWEDHFQLEDNLFITAVLDSKGGETIRICKLYRFHIMIKHARENKISNETQMKRFSHMLYLVEKDSDEFNSIKEAIDHCSARIN